MKNQPADLLVHEQNDMDNHLSFGAWLKRRRKSLDLTQTYLAERVYCSIATIQKIEADERRPSRNLAELLANALEIPERDRPIFLKVARGERATDRLVNVTPPAEELLVQTSTQRIRLRNLPVPSSSLLGRETEISELNRLIVQSDCRLITLLGPGGMGKTRLAIALATAWVDQFAHGVCFVSLVQLNSPDFIVPTIAKALGLILTGPAEPQTQLLNYLREKEMLLVLDNLEHLLSGVGVLVDVLHFATGVKLLVTSRERLNLQNEWVYDLHGLPTPTIGDAMEIAENSAVQLFVRSAQRIRLGFTLSDKNRDAIVRICRLVDGMPLGIELAAAWIHTLSCREIAEEIEHSLDFLTNSVRDRPERHRSLRAVFDHSWRLLTGEEQQVLRQLSVFQGGFERRAAEQVAGGTLPILSALMDKSLIHRMDAGRYDFHELIRQYGAVKLNEAHEETATRQRHFDYYCSLVETAEPHLKSSGRDGWLDRLEAENGNLRAALGWGQGQTGSCEPMLQLAGALYWFWYHRGYQSEGRAWLNNPLERADNSVASSVRARALYAAGRLAHDEGDNVTARSLLEQSVALWRSLGAPGKQGLAHSLIIQGWLARDEGELALAHSLTAEGVALFREQGDRWGLAYALCNFGMVFRDETDFIEARRIIEASVSLWRELKDEWGLSVALHQLSLVALRQGDYEAARSLVVEALTLAQKSGDKLEIGFEFLVLALATLNLGDLKGSQPYFQQCQAMFNETGNKYGIAQTLHYKGYLALMEGDDVAAQIYYDRFLTLAREAGPKWLSVTYLARIAGIAAVRGQPIQAIKLWEAAETLMVASGSYLDAADRLYFERTVALALVALHEATLQAARVEGRSMSLEQAITYAMQVVGSSA
jgi:predicted ATPase/DNA-binding XRE family transcriptional regulator